MKYFLFFILFSCSHTKQVPVPKEDERVTVIRNIYKEHLEHSNKDVKSYFSKSLNRLIKLNDEICRKKAGTDICGFGADGDIFLSAQEHDPNLNIDNFIFIIQSSLIKVDFNVYPKLKDKSYYREIKFKMIQEDGKWVIDDIFYPESARKMIQEEIKFYQEH